MPRTSFHPRVIFRFRGAHRAICMAGIFLIVAASGAMGQEAEKPQEAPILPFQVDCDSKKLQPRRVARLPT